MYFINAVVPLKLLLLNAYSLRSKRFPPIRDASARSNAVLTTAFFLVTELTNSGLEKILEILEKY